MNSLTQNTPTISLFENIKVFTTLNNKQFAEYNIVYHINDCFSVNDLTKFSLKHQLLFIKYSNKFQQTNLLYIDSIFPIILADIALDVFINNTGSFVEYLQSKNSFYMFKIDVDETFLKHKFLTFIHYLLYSDVYKKSISRGEIDSKKIYAFKNETGNIDYYSILERHHLQHFLLERLKLSIDIKASTISKKEVNLCLKIQL